MARVGAADPAVAARVAAVGPAAAARGAAGGPMAVAAARGAVEGPMAAASPLGGGREAGVARAPAAALVGVVDRWAAARPNPGEAVAVSRITSTSTSIGIGIRKMSKAQKVPAKRRNEPALTVRSARYSVSVALTFSEPPDGLMQGAVRRE